MLLNACGEDKKLPEDPSTTGLDFNLVTILNVTDKAEDGSRIISLSFKDKSDNIMTMSAKSWHSHLEAGWYEIGSETGKFKAIIPTLGVDGESVKVTGGSMFVRKKDLPGNG